MGTATRACRCSIPFTVATRLYLGCSTPITRIPWSEKGGILIVANPFDPKFSLLNHPSYHTLYHEVLPAIPRPAGGVGYLLRRVCSPPGVCPQVSQRICVSRAHPCILYGQGLYALKHLGGVLAAGVPKENEAVLGGWLRAVPHDRRRAQRGRGTSRQRLYDYLSPTPGGARIFHAGACERQYRPALKCAMLYTVFVGDQTDERTSAPQ